MSAESDSGNGGGEPRPAAQPGGRSRRGQAGGRSKKEGGSNQDRGGGNQRSQGRGGSGRGGSGRGGQKRSRKKAAPPNTTKYGEGRLVIGLQPARETLRAHATRVVALLLAEKSPRHEGLEELAGHLDVPVHVVGRAELDRLARGGSHQGVAAIAPELTLWDFGPLLELPDHLGIALDGVQDPQNFGAVIRSAVAVADASVVWAEHGSAPLTPATFRASAGAVEHARLCRVRSLSASLLEAAQRDVQVIGLDAHAKHALHELDLTTPTLLVVGAEDSGLSGPVKRACSSLASVVRARKMDSLNASAAAAVALYEAHRQRTVPKDKQLP